MFTVNCSALYAIQTHTSLTDLHIPDVTAGSTTHHTSELSDALIRLTRLQSLSIPLILRSETDEHAATALLMHGSHASGSLTRLRLLNRYCHGTLAPIDAQRMDSFLLRLQESMHESNAFRQLEELDVSEYTFEQYGHGRQGQAQLAACIQGMHQLKRLGLSVERVSVETVAIAAALCAGGACTGTAHHLIVSVWCSLPSLVRLWV